MSSICHNPCSVTADEYFDPDVDLLGRDIGRPVEQVTKMQKLKARLWLSEDYPLSLSKQVLPIIDLMASSNTHFRKLKDFIVLQLPPGFPVKIGEWRPCFAYAAAKAGRERGNATAVTEVYDSVSFSALLDVSDRRRCFLLLLEIKKLAILILS